MLRCWKAGAIKQWAAVSSPGDQWFSIEVDGGYSEEYFEEDTSDVDVVDRLGVYLAAAAYVAGESEVRRSKGLHLAFLVVPTDFGTVELHKSLSARLRELAGTT